MYIFRLEKLFAFVLQHVHDCAFEEDQAQNQDLNQGLETIQKLTPFLFDLSKFFPQSAAKAILSVVQEKYEEFVKQPKMYPTLDTVRFRGLLGVLFFWKKVNFGSNLNLLGTRLMLSKSNMKSFFLKGSERFWKNSPKKNTKSLSSSQKCIGHLIRYVLGGC